MILLKIFKKKLVNILNILNLISEKKPINDIFENFLIIKKNKKIYFIINNNNTQIKKIIKLKKIKKLKKNQIITFSLNNFTKIIKNFPECKITLNLKNKKLIIKNKKIKYSLIIKKINNYTISKKENKEKFKIKTILFLNLINSINFLIKNINNKNAVNKTLILIKNNKIKLISTDNYRLISDETELFNKKNLKKKIILQNKVLFVIYNIMKWIKKKNILIIINKNQIKFKVKNLEIISDILKESYPTLKNNIKENNNNFCIKKKDLHLSLKRASVITEKINNFSKWIVNEKKLKILTKWNLNEGEEIIDIKYIGEKISFGINISHMLDLTSSFESEDLIFSFSKKNKIITILNLEKKNFKYVTTTIKI